VTSEKAVSLLELLRAYAEIFADSSYWLGFNMFSVWKKPPDASAKATMLLHLKKLREECERVNLEMTLALLDEFIPMFENDDGSNGYGFHEQVRHICDDLQRELSLRLFISIRSEHRKRFDSPFSGWEELIKRFGGISRDVEEMNKCFALSRYTAAMYHAMQIAEGGAIELGDYIEVSDHRKGWGPTEKKLRELIKAGHDKLPPKLTGRFVFLEQMHREIDSMVLAWRNKLDHAANNLAILPNTDFTPDIAEHIIGAVRIFMIRLKEGLPV
jgi:hypothetical protein